MQASFINSGRTVTKLLYIYYKGLCKLKVITEVLTFQFQQALLWMHLLGSKREVLYIIFLFIFKSNSTSHDLFRCDLIFPGCPFQKETTFRLYITCTSYSTKFYNISQFQREGDKVTLKQITFKLFSWQKQILCDRKHIGM